jgi:hypothetical protein
MQIFEELRRVGRRHELSAGLLLGGKDVGEEAERVAGMNVLVATPGRLLQHMDETPGFDAGALQVLVLDEADRILDMVSSFRLPAAALPGARVRGGCSCRGNFWRSAWAAERGLLDCPWPSPRPCPAPCRASPPR